MDADFPDGILSDRAHLLDRAEQILKEHRRDTDLVTLDVLAGEFDIYPRTLRAAARDGRLHVHLSTKSVRKAFATGNALGRR